MRALSYRQASVCETAKHKRCRCRCGGQMHGASRLTPSREAFEALPADDPHHVPNEGERQQRLLHERRRQLEREQQPLPMEV
jgi:hypothetical protein